MSQTTLSHAFPHTNPAVQRTAQTMFLLKSVPATKQILIDVNGAASHTWNMRIPAEDWKSMVPVIESSIDSAFRNESFEVTVSFMEAQGKKIFSKGNVDLADVFNAVVPSAEVA